MKLEEIYEQWGKDSEIDRTDLGDEALRIPKIHHKYYQILSHERLLMRKLESDLKKLQLDKYEFYTQGPSEYSRDKGWELPAKGKILKNEVDQYLESDNDIINLSLKIGMQKEKVELLVSIVNSLRDRSFSIRAAIDFLKFTNGQ